MREKARKELDPEDLESAEEIQPYVELDADMAILNIDITFDTPTHENPQNSAMQLAL